MIHDQACLFRDLVCKDQPSVDVKRSELFPTKMVVVNRDRSTLRWSLEAVIMAMGCDATVIKDRWRFFSLYDSCYY